MKKGLSERSTVVAGKNQVSSDVGGEVAILNLKAGMYYGLDDVGARVWALIQRPKEVSEIQAIILNEYDVDPDRCERDITSLLQNLIGEGLVEVVDEAPA
jgi:Coenzyme PQQ synthesis protein D (PqqD)